MATASLISQIGPEQDQTPTSPTKPSNGKELVVYRRKAQRPPAGQVCRVLEVKKTPMGGIGVTAMVRREAKQSANCLETSNALIEYPVTKYVVEHMSWPQFKRFGGLEILDTDLYELLEARSRWDWLTFAAFCFGKSRPETLYHFSQPRLPLQITDRSRQRVLPSERIIEIE